MSHSGGLFTFKYADYQSVAKFRFFLYISKLKHPLKWGLCLIVWYANS